MTLRDTQQSQQAPPGPHALLAIGGLFGSGCQPLILVVVAGGGHSVAA
jgi:hypothetical protein